MFHDAAMVGSWPALAARLDADAVIRRWAANQRPLADIGDVDELLTAWADKSRTQTVGESLVWLAATDGGADDDALLLLLHLLSGIVWRLVGQLGDLSSDITVIVLSELTCQIRAYRWRVRRGGLITNLEKDTRRAVLAELRPRVRRHPQWGAQVTRHGRLDTFDVPTNADGSVAAGEDIDIVDLVSWAVQVGVPAADIALVVDFECARGHRGVGGQDVVSRQHGVSRRTLYRRREQTLTALRSAAAAYLAAVA